MLAERAYHGLRQMLTINKNIDCVQVGAGTAVQCDLVHDLPFLMMDVTRVRC